MAQAQARHQAQIDHASAIKGRLLDALETLEAADEKHSSACYDFVEFHLDGDFPGTADQFIKSLIETLYSGTWPSRELKGKKNAGERGKLYSLSHCIKPDSGFAEEQQVRAVNAFRSWLKRNIYTSKPESEEQGDEPAGENDAEENGEATEPAKPSIPSNVLEFLHDLTTCDHKKAGLTKKQIAARAAELVAEFS